MQKIQFHWICGISHGELTTMPYPQSKQGLETALQTWRAEGVDIVVSMLPLGEAMLLGLAQEAFLCTKHDMEFHNIRVQDLQTPDSRQHFFERVAYMLEQLSDNKRIAIHCRMGVGRASVMAACILVAQGNTVDEAFSRISEARGLRVPDNPAQVVWVETFAKELQSIRLHKKNMG